VDNGLDERWQILLGQVLQSRNRIETGRIRHELFEADAELSSRQAEGYGGDRNAGARHRQGQDVLPEELPGKMDQGLRPQFRCKGEAQDRAGGLPESTEPIGAARAQKSQEDHELQRRDKFFGRCKLTLLAGLFEPLLGRLLGFPALVRHGVSYTQHAVGVHACR
jgi:hypothetical protein